MASSGDSSTPSYIYSSKEETFGGLLFTFTEPVPSYLTCIICYGVLKDAVATECCGKMFCYEHSSFTRDCPVCRHPRVTVVRNKGIDGIVKDLKVFCLNHKEGCSWSGHLCFEPKHRVACDYHKTEVGASGGGPSCPIASEESQELPAEEQKYTKMNTAAGHPGFPIASLYDGDLNPEVNEATLYEFGQAGPVVSKGPSCPIASEESQELPTEEQRYTKMNAVVGQPGFPIASLYVGDLHPEVNEAILYEKFSQAGPVVSIRVCRDELTRRSLGYAYVNFQQPADAERALDTMNFDVIKDRPCIIMWSQRDPSLRRSGVGSIFIKHLDKAIDNETLFDTFSAFGNILSCKVAQNEMGESKGYGFVRFETQEAADTAIKKVHGMLLNGKKVCVDKFKPRNERMRDGPSQRFTNLYVENFGEDFGEEQLRELFLPFGAINSLVVMKDEAGQSKGFGFVSYDSHVSAAQAVEELNGKVVGDQEIYVSRAMQKSEERQQRFQGVNLYIKNLEEEIDDAQLREEFSKFGTITSAKVMRDERGVTKGFGFVCFSSPEEATKAVTEMNGRILISRPLYVALHQRKEERQAQLYAQRVNQMTPRGFPGPGSMPYYAPMFPMGMPQSQQPYFPPMQYPRPNQWGQAPGVGRTTRPYGQSVYGRRGRGGGRMGGMSRGVTRLPSGAPARNVPSQPRPTPPTFPGAPRGTQVKYTAVARNHPALQTAGSHIPPQDIPGSAVMQRIFLSDLTAMGPQGQKQLLGERLYMSVMTIDPQFCDMKLAGKITEMLLEMDNPDILDLLESQDALREKVQEAIAVLEAPKQKESTTTQLPTTAMAGMSLD